MKKTQPTHPGDLRVQAEERLRAQKKSRPFLAEGDARRLLHELEVHQIELEMQNQELREARTEIEVGLDRYTDLYDFAPVGYFTLSPGGTILQLNLAGARLLGTERARLMEARFGLFISEGDRPTFEAFLAKTLASRGGWEACEVSLVKEGYPPLFAQIEGSASSDRREFRIAVVDVTDRKRAEEQARFAALEAERARSSETVAALVTGLAHEVRNPLFALQVNAAAIVKPDLNPEERASHMAHIETQIKRLDLLMRDLLALADRPGEKPRRECALLQLVLAAVADIETILPAASGKIRVIVPEDLTIRTLPQGLSAVLVHLLQNALQHFPDGSGAEISAERSKCAVTIRVRDEGEGLPPGPTERLFEPFWTTRTGHRGLGLALARHHIESNGGTLTAENNDPGPGATFTVRLPLDGKSDQ